MESITKQLVNIGHGMSREIAADEPAVAKLLVELSSALDVQYERGNSLEAKCAALAAEVQAVKALARGWANATDDRLFEEHGEIFHDSIDACEEELKTICPATDAFLAEVRAQGVEMFASKCKEESKRAHSSDARDSWWVSGENADDFASEIRKGVQS